MPNCIYAKHGFVIIPFKRGYIVHNTKKPFKTGHTHIAIYKNAKRVIYHAHRRTVPDCYNSYFIESLIRVSTDSHFKKTLTAIKVSLGDYKGYNRINKEEKCWKRNPKIKH